MYQDNMKEVLKRLNGTEIEENRPISNILEGNGTVENSGMRKNCI